MGILLVTYSYDITNFVLKKRLNVFSEFMTVSVSQRDAVRSMKIQKWNEFDMNVMTWSSARLVVVYSISGIAASVWSCFARFRVSGTSFRVHASPSLRPGTWRVVSRVQGKRIRWTTCGHFLLIKFIFACQCVQLTGLYYMFVQ